MSKLQNIFNSITPDNIKDIPLIKDAMEVFIETLEDLSKESIEIKNIYDNEIIREELIKIYLDDLYNVLKQIQVNQKIIDRIDAINATYNAGKLPTDPQYEYISKDIITNISKYINEEHFFSFRSYKEKKGTKAALSYMYSLISSFVNTGDDNVEFSIEETGSPFHFNVFGPLPVEFYEYIIYPLAHPLGFTYTYSQYINLLLQDYFPEEQFFYTVNVLEVRCLQLDGSTITTDYSDRGVIKVENVVENSIRVKKIYFDAPYEGEYLEQQTTEIGQTTVYLKDETGILVSYSDQCSIYFDYDFDIRTSVVDELAYEMDAYTTDTFPTDSVVDEIFNEIDTGNETRTSKEYAITCNQYLVVGGNYLGTDLKVGDAWINVPRWFRIGGDCDGSPILIGESYINTYQTIDIVNQEGDVYFDYPGFHYFSDDDFTFEVYRDGVLLPDNNV